MKLEWKDTDSPSLIGAMQILLHLVACWIAGSEPSEEARTVARKFADELQAICRRPLTGASQAVEQDESRKLDLERKVADLCRPWTPPPAEQLTMFDQHGTPLETFPAPAPDVAELTRAASDEHLDRVADSYAVEMSDSAAKSPADFQVEDFSPEEQARADRATARLVDLVANLERAILAAHHGGGKAQKSRAVVLKLVAMQGHGQDDRDRLATHADLVERNLLAKTGRQAYELTAEGRRILGCAEAAKESAQEFRSKLSGRPMELEEALLDAAQDLQNCANSKGEIVGCALAALEMPDSELKPMFELFEALVERGALYRKPGYGGHCVDWSKLASPAQVQTIRELRETGTTITELPGAVGVPFKTVQAVLHAPAGVA